MERVLYCLCQHQKEVKRLNWGLTQHLHNLLLFSYQPFSKSPSEHPPFVLPILHLSEFPCPCCSMTKYQVGTSEKWTATVNLWHGHMGQVSFSAAIEFPKREICLTLLRELSLRRRLGSLPIPEGWETLIHWPQCTYFRPGGQVARKGSERGDLCQSRETDPQLRTRSSTPPVPHLQCWILIACQEIRQTITLNFRCLWKRWSSPQGLRWL